MIHQKVAKDDTRYKQEREQTELFAPLDIRGKDSIYEGLEEIVKAELMDGDNQVFHPSSYQLLLCLSQRLNGK